MRLSASNEAAVYDRGFNSELSWREVANRWSPIVRYKSIIISVFDTYGNLSQISIGWSGNCRTFIANERGQLWP